MSGLREQLDEIHAAHGVLTPALVVAAATPDDSPLHNRLTWDNEIAGHRYRMIEARDLIRSVKITYREREDGEPVRCRAYVARYADDGYVPVREALADDVGSEIVLREFRRQVAALQRTYGHLEEFRNVIRADLLGETG